MEQKPKLTFGEINSKNLEQFKIITQRHYQFLIAISFIRGFSLIKTFLHQPHYRIFIMILQIEDQDEVKTAYIMTFGVLDAYRRLGFGSQLLYELINRINSYKEIRRIYLHIWSNNDVGFQFYLSHGFEKTKYMKNYYTNIEPPHCYILTKRLYPDEDPPIQYIEQDFQN
ncbi:unnamed protein product (macronuclear) [Paramecium tetraurelia]|uniref:N-acetyltransferase domain-containing protein n=1 Tax=Paramecium tetraurelia TaxID=5888 RepID=A0CWR3_PARTE|nr:uncharacterized protein GSPATT00001433001 [Paramecium tetraurelia]CAK75230.1 unnamed protein product [Paramecium tetraurelia]|eukprot:XP_001442627.1 hypothetical protein (macronuclear) [Paramecium tetraurelia strain d4-2]